MGVWVWPDVSCFRQCALLELTTDATVLLYCCRPERTPDNPAAGRDEIIYHNARGLQDEHGSALYTDIIGSARALADHLVEGWTDRQGAYDRSARQQRIQAMQGGVAAHRLARFDGETADLLIGAIFDLDWSSFGLSTPLSLTPPVHRHDHFSPTFHPATGLHPASSAASTTLSRLSSLSISGHIIDDGGHDGDDSNETASSAAPFVGRRARQLELRFMNRLGLTELQKAQVRLVMWESHPDRWYTEMQPLFSSQNQVLFSLLGVLFEDM